MKDYKLIGGVLLNRDGMFFPGTLRLIFKKNNVFYTQTSLLGPHPETFLEHVQYIPISSSCFANEQDFKFIPINEEKFELDKSKRLYGFALSNANVYLGNLKQITEILQQQNVRGEMKELKEHFEFRLEHFEKYGYSPSSKNYVSCKQHSL